MQEPSLVFRNCLNIYATLKQFQAGQSKFISFDVSRTTTSCFSSRYQTLKREGLLEGKFKFSNVSKPAGTVITRIE